MHLASGWCLRRASANTGFIPAMIEKTFTPAEMESRLYDAWESHGFFKPGRKPKAKPFTIVIPPPNVTGSLHMGHALNNTIQDILVRFERMRGRDVLWQPGTDHAGIATQMVVERLLLKENKTDRRTMGREAFLEARLGMEGGIGRRHLAAAAAAGRVLRLVARALHHGRGPVARRAQGLRAALQGRADLQGQAPGELGPEAADRHLRSGSGAEGGQGHISGICAIRSTAPDEVIVVATTRPETMLGDTAVAVHPENETLKHLIGKFVRLPLVGRLIPIVADEYADPEKGTGAVKITPAHDFNDFEVGKRHDLPADQHPRPVRQALIARTLISLPECRRATG